MREKDKEQSRTSGTPEGNGEDKLRSIWSRAMALRGLKRVLSVSLEAAKVSTLDENGDVLEIKFNPSAANAATKAIETANKMLGYHLAPEEETDEAEDSEIRVIFSEEGEDFSG